LLNYRGATCAFAVFAVLAYSAPHASAADKLRAGKATSDTWPYGALDIGVEERIFVKYNFDVEVTVLSGGARFQQPLAVMGKAYDFEIARMRDDGVSNPEGLKVLKESIVELGMLKEMPSDDQILAKQFLPVKSVRPRGSRMPQRSTVWHRARL
jgi:hypothetical protein